MQKKKIKVTDENRNDLITAYCDKMLGSMDISDVYDYAMEKMSEEFDELNNSKLNEAIRGVFPGLLEEQAIKFFEDSLCIVLVDTYGTMTRQPRRNGVITDNKSSLDNMSPSQIRVVLEHLLMTMDFEQRMKLMNTFPGLYNMIYPEVKI